MAPENAEHRLRDYLWHGLFASISEAEQARAMAEAIGDSASEINSIGLGGVFGALQLALSDRETLATRKLYDQPNRRYPLRSIPTVLSSSMQMLLRGTSATGPSWLRSSDLETWITKAAACLMKLSAPHSSLNARLSWRVRRCWGP